MLSSPVCFALGEQILAQSADVIHIGILAIGIVFVVLFASLILLKVKLKGAEKKS
ncbi:MAG: hypothetical protein ACI8Z9_001188, partial [Paraglaciecola sp.]